MPLERNVSFPINAINPRTGQPFTSAASNAALIKAKATSGLAQYQDVAMKRIVEVMAEQSVESMGTVLTIFGEALRSKYSKSRSTEMKNVHEKAAQAAQQAMLNRYAKIVKPRSVGEYRSQAAGKWKRYSGGQLEAALASPNFYRAAQDGILFANITHLDERAPQWYRVNYGAGARGRGYRAQASFPSDPSGLNLLPKSFTASGSYLLPKGFFGDIGEFGQEARFDQAERFRTEDITRVRGGARLGRRFGKKRGSPLEFGPGGFENGTPASSNFSSSPFHPAGYVLAKTGSLPDGPSVGPKISRGFAGAFFIEAGMKRMGQVLPASYKGLARRWLKEAAAATPSGPLSKIVDTPNAKNLLAQVEADINLTSFRGNQRFFK